MSSPWNKWGGLCKRRSETTWVMPWEVFVKVSAAHRGTSAAQKPFIQSCLHRITCARVLSFSGLQKCVFASLCEHQQRRRSSLFLFKCSSPGTRLIMELIKTQLQSNQTGSSGDNKVHTYIQRFRYCFFFFGLFLHFCFPYSFFNLISIKPKWLDKLKTIRLNKGTCVKSVMSGGFGFYFDTWHASVSYEIPLDDRK